jgi:hypothetical protein
VLVPPGDAVALADGIVLAYDQLDALSTGARAAAPSWTLVAGAITSSFENVPLATAET